MNNYSRESNYYSPHAKNYSRENKNYSLHVNSLLSRE